MLVIIVFDRQVVWHNINSPWCNFPLLLPHPTKKAPDNKPIRWIHNLEFQAPLRKMLFQPTIPQWGFLIIQKFVVRYILTPNIRSSGHKVPPNHSPSPAFAGIVQGLLDFPDAWRPLTYHTPGAGTGARSATAWTARTPTKWFLGRQQKNGRRIEEGTYLTYFYRKKKGEILQFTLSFRRVFF